MRGYASLGKRIITVHRPSGDKTVVHVIYKQYGYEKYLARFERIFYRVTHDNSGWHLTIKVPERKEV